MPLERGQLVWLDINHGCSLIQLSCLMKMITVTLYVVARARVTKEQWIVPTLFFLFLTLFLIYRYAALSV